MAVLGALGDLVLSLSADTAKFQSDLGKADRIAGKFSRDVGRSLGILTGAFIALGGATGILVRSQINAADEAGKMAQKVGMSVESLSAYMVAAQLADVSNQQLQTGFQQLAKNQADFVNGTGEAKDAFAALGITTQQLNALNGDTAALFDLVAGKLAKFEDGANKTAIAMKIFGKSGAELIPLMNELEQTRKEAEMLSAVIDKETATAAEKFNDNLTRVGISVRAVGLGIAKELLPVMGQLAQEAAAAAKGTKDLSLAGDFARVVFQTLTVLGANVSFVLKGIGRDLGGMAAQLVALANLDFAGFAAIGDALKEDAARARAELDAFEQRIMSVGTAAEATGKTLEKKTAPALRNIAQEAKEAEERFKALKAAIMAVHDDALAAAEADQEIERRHIEARDKAMNKLHDEAMAAADADAELIKREQDLNALIREQYESLGKVERAARDFGFTFNSQLEDAIINGKKLDEVVIAIGNDIARMILRRTVTEPLGNAVTAAIPKIAEKLFGVPGGVDGTNILDPTLFGFQHGGRFTVGGDGGADSQLVAFKATPGEEVSVRTPAQQGGAQSLNVTFNITSLDPSTEASVVVRQRKIILGMIEGAYAKAGRRSGMAHG